ncbi:hypothetical protein NRB20_01330 [Nocardia sp. RB20]|uniref:Uncharacterized protein n=1 Tax=Nocardia macrotermitis TaxID=2585198 RepID=A0A7K0CUB8_9NOCA|nr:hypothetical protein [Nocardia macrotermitis]
MSGGGGEAGVCCGDAFFGMGMCSELIDFDTGGGEVSGVGSGIGRGWGWLWNWLSANGFRCRCVVSWMWSVEFHGSALR